jgi:peptidoglycan-associated lipoprotein
MKRELTSMLLGLVCACFLVIGAGCAKKQVSSTPSGEAVEQAGQAETGYQEAEEEMEARRRALKEGQVEEYGIQGEELQARQREQQAEEARAEKVQSLKEPIHFAFDSYELSSEARSTLKDKAETLEMHPDWKVVIEGHCDERGTDEYNLALGERRARAAYEFLVLLGIDADRLSIISYGEEKPVDPDHTEAAWAKNRRDEFRVIR